MSVQSIIEEKLRSEFSPTYLQVVNESHMHKTEPGAESHFNVTLVTEQFDGVALLVRHRRVNGLLAELLATCIHALALHTFTPMEWRQKGEISQKSPPCRGG